MKSDKKVQRNVNHLNEGDETLIPGTRMRVDWSGLVSGQDIALSGLPDNVYSALRLGNGDIGVAVYAILECLTLCVGKNDLLDYRLEAPGNFNVPMPSSKPAGSIRFRNSVTRNRACRTRLNLWDAEISVCPDKAGSPEIRTFVSKKRNLIVAEYKSANGQNFDIEIARNRDSTGFITNLPEFGAEGRDIWVRYKFPASPGNYPDGFEYVMYGRVLGGTIVNTDVVNEFATVKQWYGWDGPVKQAVEGVARARVKSSEPVTVLVAVVTTRDNSNPLKAARANVDAAQRAGLLRLRREHIKLWHRFWQRSFVQLTDRDFLNQQWFLSQYLLACISRPGSIAPGMVGPWIWEDFPAWGNDYHWDYQMQATIWGAYSSNHLEQTEAYTNEVFNLLPAAKLGTQEYGGIPGAKYPVMSWPRKYDQCPAPKKYGGPFLNGMVAHPMWWYYQYSQDIEFLRQKGYPVIKACAEFYENFVERAPDGKYDMPPTGCWDLVYQILDTRNCTMDLAFAKMLLETVSAASQILGVDAERRNAWNRIAANLRDYPTTVIDGKNFKPVDRKGGGAVPLYTSRDFPSGEVLVAYENFPVIEYNMPIPPIPIFPSGDIGLDSPQKQRELALRTLQITPYYRWDDIVLLSMAWVRLGYDQLDVFETHSRSLRLINGCIAFPDVGWVWSKYIFTANFGWPLVVNESIVQSYTGQIRIAPVKLKNTVRFARLRTVGAFLVSGEIRSGGRVSYITITSEAGRVCRLVRPWDENVRIRPLGSEEIVKFTEENSVLTFPTVADLTYIVDRPDDPWEKYPIIRITGQQ